MTPETTTPASTIFSRRVRPGFEARYETWLANIVQATSSFEGNQGTTILRPGEGREEYISITQFDSEEHLENWLRSDERKAWLEKLRGIDICREQIISLGGMERWFTLPDQGATRMPPRYKTAALVFLGLYPVVLILNLCLSPALKGLPAPLQVLFSLMISVPIMVWIVLPYLTRLFFGWLHPSPSALAVSEKSSAKRD